MNLTVHQSIVIQQLRVDSITNSSILQIGSAGVIKPAAYLYNTGGFTGPAPTFAPTQPPNNTTLIPSPATQSFPVSSALVPLPPPTPVRSH